VNRDVIVGWVRDWLPRARQSVAALAPLVPRGVDGLRAESQARSYSDELLSSALTPPRRRATPERRPNRAPAARTSAATDGAYDYVGIVMAKSAEGDAVARILARCDGISVRDQPAFWDIRARNRLVIPYDDVSAELGYKIDAYSIQHEMSTHYGRMVATDDALILFSDPVEAMEHLMA
jgi:propane monooxygenase coupling protein